MTHIHVKLAVAAVLILTAVGFLAFNAAKGGWVYYLPVDEFVEAEYPTKRVRLHGLVAEEGFDASSALLQAKFNLQGETQAVAIEYEGALPDMFQAGREVVVEGSYDPVTCVFEADTLMTKCASKYEGHEEGSVPEDSMIGESSSPAPAPGDQPESSGEPIPAGDDR